MSSLSGFTIEALPAMLGSVIRADPGQPLITYYDDATGERFVVSAQMLGRCVNGTANLLVNGCGYGHGNHAAILLPPHWQTAAVLLGAWSAGMSVGFHLAATAGLPQPGPEERRAADVTFVSTSRLNDMIERVPHAPVRFALGLAPNAAPLRDVPEGFLDFITAVRVHEDGSGPSTGIRGADAATADGVTYQQWGSLARELAHTRGIGPGDRVLVDATEREHPVWWLLAPLSVGASIVLCSNLDHAVVESRARTERVTRML